MFGVSFHCRFKKVMPLISTDNIFPIWKLAFILAFWVGEKLDIIYLAISLRVSGHAPKLPETLGDKRASQLSWEQ